jgi:hypothetical protein
MRCAQVKELYTGKEIAVQDGSFDYDFASPDTALFEVFD